MPIYKCGDTRLNGFLSQSASLYSHTENFTATRWVVKQAIALVFGSLQPVEKAVGCEYSANFFDDRFSELEKSLV